MMNKTRFAALSTALLPRRASVLLAQSLVALCLAGTMAACSSPPPPAPLDGAKIGGAFTLTDQNGRTVRDSDFAGQYRLVYFGYSYCPDICPVDLQKLMRGLAQFEKSEPELAAKVAPLFITVDPERDTPAALKPFVARYHPRLLGLTGDAAAIKDVTGKYVVVYSKQPGSTPDAYLMAHSQQAYLMGPKGEPIALLPLDDPSTDADEGRPEIVAADLAKWVR